MIVQGRLLIDAHQTPQPGWLVVEGERITEIHEGSPPGKPDAGGSGSVICPGFIDAHLHLPQFNCVGFDGLDLIDWLNRVIYPAEAEWNDELWAQAQSAHAYLEMIESGTLGCAGFLSSNPRTLEDTAMMAKHSPLRARLGVALMDRNAPAELLNADIGAPHDLEITSLALQVRITPSINPRFAVSCSDDLLAASGRWVKKHPGTFVHTHLAESQPECDLIRKLFPDAPHYTGVYDQHGLLSKHTLLAHGVHLSDEEWELIARRESVVVHCPAANLFLRSGLFDLETAQRHGVRLALGSDVAAGPELAMPRVARAMIETAKIRSMTVDRAAYIPSPAEAWNLITRGNADALGWPDAGRLEVGDAADLLILSLPDEIELNDYFISRLIYTWRNEYIKDFILRGVRGPVCKTRKRAPRKKKK